MRRALVEALRVRAVDVLTALEAGMIQREDDEHLEYATVQERVLYSYNVGDFSRIHSNYLSQGRSHAGIILATPTALFGGRASERPVETHRRQFSGRHAEPFGIPQSLDLNFLPPDFATSQIRKFHC